MAWLPPDFDHPRHVDLPGELHLRPIRAIDVDIDLPAVMGSRERLWAAYGDSWGWPPASMTAEQDREDLAHHEAEIEQHLSFNYALLDADETELLGCVYLDPSPDDAVDCEASWWVVDRLVGTPAQQQLDAAIRSWLTDVWPFERWHLPHNSDSGADWRGVDEGWGRRATDFATLSEPGNVREYVALHHRLGVDAGDRLLDVACGSGLALELAAARGAACAGIDASARLVEVAKRRSPEADVRVGDMNALPWPDASFDVVTSFRGIWGTTPAAVGEIRRVLVPGGRVGFTVWGHLKMSPGAWALHPFRLAANPKVENQAAMVSLGRPGQGEQLLASWGFVDIERVDIPFAWEFADPHLYARALAATGPAYEAIQNVGEDAFLAAAAEQAREHAADGALLRAEIAVVGFLARTPGPETIT